MLKNAAANSKVRWLAKTLEPAKALRAAGIWGSSDALIAAAVQRASRRTILIVTGHLEQADETADDVEVLTGSPAQLFPAWEVDIATDHLNSELTGERVRICNLLTQPPEARDEEVRVIVAPVLALLQPVPTPDALAGGRLTLKV
ncbi:MAG: hypothetical protein ACLFVU_13980, partial [Phycisphaerae bacterium]